MRDKTISRLTLCPYVIAQTNDISAKAAFNSSLLVVYITIQRKLIKKFLFVIQTSYLKYTEIRDIIIRQ